MNRGNRKALIFEDDRDRRWFLRLLAASAQEYQVRVLSTCLMGNHFHLKVTTPNANISEFMDALQGEFAKYVNWRYHLVGHVFQGRFRSVVIDNDLHLLTAACYVFMNPVVAGLTTRLESWKWSSYAATAGLAPCPDYLSLDWLDALFPGDTRLESQRKFRDLMNTSQPVIAYLQQAEKSVGPEAFRVVIQTYVGKSTCIGPIPPTYRSLLRPTLDKLFGARMDVIARAELIVQAHLEYGYTFAEIATSLRLHHASVGRIFRATRATSRPESID